MTLSAVTVSEPSTIIYGKVLHRSHGNEHQLREGTLTWTLSDQSGVPYTFTVELEDVGGVYSYRVSIPHQVLASGLSIDSSVIPLAVGEVQYGFDSIQLNGSPAEILWSESDSLELLQSSRAATYRVDLQVSYDLIDTDRDGMPDWWEQANGLDWQTPNGDLDPDGDGWSHLAEFLGGTDPFQDDRIPSIQTLNVAAYGESENGVWLRSVDADTAPSELIFTLTSLPGGGDLHMVPTPGNESDPVVSLMIGETFSQEQLNQGLIAFKHSDPTVTESSFGLSLSDGEHDPFEAEIAVAVFPPDPESVVATEGGSTPEWWRNENVVFDAYWGLRENVLSGDLVESALLYLLGKNYGWTIWDERTRTLPVTLAATGAGSHFLLGGDGEDVLVGSAQDDIIAGGPGADRLRGGEGLDLFIVGDVGLEIVEDFNTAVDVLDLGELVLGQSSSLNDYLLASFDGTHTEIQVDQNGDGSGFTDATIRLEGLALSQDDLNRLWSLGQLLLGSVQGMGSVTIEGWPTDSLEEGYSTSELIVRRNGPTNQPLTVALAVSGSATNGVDYSSVPASISFLVGQSTMAVPVEPLLDGNSEFIEVIDLGLVAGTGYVLGETASGQITIVDAKQRFSVQALQSFAVVNEAPTYLQIVRQGPKSGVIQLLLTTGGSGTKNVDYAAIPTLITFSDNQSSFYIPVEALAGGSLAGDQASKTVTVSIRSVPSEDYLLGTSPSATVRLLSETQRFETWVAEAIDDADPGLSPEELRTLRSQRTGLSAFLEYASSYGVNLADGVAPAERLLLMPRIHRDETGLYFEFPTRLNDPRLDYVVESSLDLVEWNGGPEYFEAVPLNEAEENAGRVRYRVLEPDGPGGTYMRVRVELNE